MFVIFNAILAQSINQSINKWSQYYLFSVLVNFTAAILVHILLWAVKIVCVKHFVVVRPVALTVFSTHFTIVYLHSVSIDHHKIVMTQTSP